MADFLTRLVERVQGSASVAQPIIAPMFAPGPAMTIDEQPASAPQAELPMDTDEDAVIIAPGPAMTIDEQPASAPQAELPMDADEDAVLVAPEVEQRMAQPGRMTLPLVPQGDTASATPLIDLQQSESPGEMPDSPRTASPQRPSQVSEERHPSMETLVFHPNTNPGSAGPIEDSPTPAQRNAQNPQHFEETRLTLSDLTSSDPFPDSGADRKSREGRLKKEQPLAPIDEKLADRSEAETPLVRGRTIGIPPLTSESMDTEVGADGEHSRQAAARRDHDELLAPQPTVASIQSTETSVPERIRPAIIALRESTLADEREVTLEDATPTPTIRVTIGRIEVRANTPPPSVPRRTSARPRPALSLDAYLKRRNGGKS